MLIGVMLFMGFSLNAQTYLTVGTGTSSNSNTGYPAPYGNYWTGAKHQMIILASELQALGGGAGSITSLAFDVASAQGVALTGFTIKMGATTATSVSSSWESGLTTVYSVSAYTDVAGWNTHTFTTPFVWDGTSNIIVETCFDKYQGTANYTSNAHMYYSTLGFTASHYYYSDGGGVCPSTASGSTSTKRPNMKLGIVMSPQTNDLAMVEWVSPQSPVAPSATMPITVKFRNAGIVTQDTFDLKYSIDGGTTFITETINDTIGAGDTLSYTFTATANMPMGIYNCVAQVKNTGDTMTANDEITYTVYSGNPLSGVYTIGADTNDDFSSFSQAVNMLESFGISGAVTFNADAGTYNEQVSLIGPISGASMINTITFKGQGASTIITAAPSTSNRDIFYIENQNYVTLDSLTLTATGSTYNCGIRIKASDSLTITNCNINVPTNVTSSYTNGLLVSGSRTSNYSSSHANYLRFENNTVTGGYYSLKLYGTSSTHGTNMSVISNNLIDFYNYGIYSYYQDSVEYTHNKLVSRSNGYSPTGIYCYKNYLGSKVAYNNIVNNGSSSPRGLYINYCEASASNPFMVYNNMVSITQASSSPNALYSYYGKYVHYYYNTFNINSGGSNSRAVYLRGSTSSSNFVDIQFKNNIVVNSASGYAMYIYSSYYPNKLTVCDYNNIVGNSTHFGYYSGAKADLAAWKASASGLDTNSVSIDPVFIAVDDLHAASIPMNGLANPITGIDDDIDGEIRNSSTPDMGADEYTPPANEVAVIEYFGASGIGCGRTSSEQVGIVLHNNGTNSQTNIPVKFTVDGGTAVSETVTSLASLATDTFYFVGTADLSVAGVHSIKAYVDMTVDENRANDTITVAVTSIGSINSFPYTQDFESTYTEMGLASATNSNAAIDTRAANGGNNGLILTGNVSSGWISPYNTVQGAFNNSTTHVATATSCDVDATGLSNLKLKFDMKMNATYNTTYGWFRVMLNDTVYAKDINGDSTWNASSSYSNGDPFQNLVFDLTAYAGTHFTISYQGACKYSKANYGAFGDEIFVDNIYMWEVAQNDLGVTGLDSPVNTICEDSVMPVAVLVTNYGLASQSNVPVTAVVTLPSGSNVTLTGVSGTIAPNATDTVTLGTVNASAYGVYNVMSYATLASDTMYQDNDTLSTSFEVYAPVPVDFVEDFENASPYWFGTNMSIGSGHGNPGKGLYQNFYSYNATGDAHFGRKIGPITTGSNFVVDYQIVDYSGGAGTALEADSFFFMVSDDCGNTMDTLFVVDSNSHAASTAYTHIQIPLTNYVGENIIIAFAGQHNGSGDYYFNIDNFGVATPPTVSLGVDTAICDNTTLTLDAGTGAGYAYLWTANGDTLSATTSSIAIDSAATYTVEVNAPAGMAYDTIVITLNAAPVVSFTGLASSYCNNEMAATLVGMPANGTFSGNGVSASMFDPSTSGLGAQIINYSYTDSNSCTSDINDTTFVYEAPVATMTMDTAICEGQSVTISAGSAVAAPGLFFSSYIEGSSNNKALEVYNGSADTLMLDNYSIMTNYNGHTWSGQYHFPAGATLVPGDVFVIANSSADATILAVADDSLAYNEGGYVVGFNGDDVRALYKYSATDSMMIDIIGRYDLVDPGSGWDVAGVANATKDHTLKRKSTIVGGNTDWDAIAGTDSVSSEYLVYPKNDFSMIGSHAAMASVAPSYAWSTGDTTAMITVNPTSTTVYTVTVSNTNCTDVDSVTVTVNPLPVVSLGADTTIKWSWAITLDAGNPNAAWTWSTGATTQTETFDSTNLVNATANTVYVDVVENGCAASDTIVITVLDDVSINGSLNNVDMNIYPNPNNGRYTMTIEGVNGTVNMEVIDIAGQVVYREKLEATANYSAQFDMSTLAKGVYYIKLTNNDGVKTQKLIIK